MSAVEKQVWTGTVTEELHEVRFDKVVATLFPDVSRTHFVFLIEQGLVTVNGKIITLTKHKVSVGDVIVATDSHKHSENDIPLCDVHIPVIYEDEFLMVIDKPYDLIVHPAGKTKDSVIGALLNRDVELSDVDEERPGVVHRLDKTTTGVMVVAKDAHTHQKLAKQFMDRRVKKEYTAVVRGRLMQRSGEIITGLKRVPGDFKVRVSDEPDAKNAITLYECIKSKPPFHLMRIEIKTGRMHQIRAHMKHIGMPVVGDVRYGGVPSERIMLHATTLAFFHPSDGRLCSFRSEPPASFLAFVEP
jgi:23S rRNA pseudouridine1911/1915/1917 synthase